MGFPRQEYWSGMPFPSPGDLPDPGIEQVDSLPPVPPGKPYDLMDCSQNSDCREVNFCAINAFSFL